MEGLCSSGVLFVGGLSFENVGKPPLPLYVFSIWHRHARDRDFFLVICVLFWAYFGSAILQNSFLCIVHVKTMFNKYRFLRSITLIWKFPVELAYSSAHIISLLNIGRAGVYVHVESRRGMFGMWPDLVHRNPGDRAGTGSQDSGYNYQALQLRQAHPRVQGFPSVLHFHRSQWETGSEEPLSPLGLWLIFALFLDFCFE